jgi:hypothetical protein
MSFSHNFGPIPGREKEVKVDTHSMRANSRGTWTTRSMERACGRARSSPTFSVHATRGLIGRGARRHQAPHASGLDGRTVPA